MNYLVTFGNCGGEVAYSGAALMKDGLRVCPGSALTSELIRCRAE